MMPSGKPELFRLFTLLPFLLLSICAPAKEVRVVVLRAQFSDVRFSDTDNQKTTLLRAEEYLSSQFSGVHSVSLSRGPVVTLSGTRASYASNSATTKDTGIGNAVKEACLLSDASVDFSLCDHLAVMFSGESESDGGNPECVWPQQNSLISLSCALTLDGKMLDKFIDFTETSGAGTICHEYLHLFGLCDMYDTDGEWSGGLSKGLWGCTSIMDKGALNDEGNTPPELNAIELECLGIGTMEQLTEGIHTLEPIGRDRRFFRCDTPESGEYFLFECRSNEGWDKFAGGSGLLIYHVDKSSGNAWYSDRFKRNLTGLERWNLNQVNCRPDHSCAKIIEATPSAELASELFYPQSSRNCFGSDTDPAWRYWDGTTSELSIIDIRSLDDGGVSFKVIRPITLISCTAFQDAVILRWRTDESLGECACEVSRTAGTQVLSEKASGTSPDFGCTLEGLESGTSYEMIVRATDSSGRTFSVATKFTTKSRIGEPRPYILLSGAERNQDGSFSAGSRIFLKVYNATDVSKVEWTLGTEKITPDLDGKFTLLDDGELKARIFYRDGNTETICKKITIR